MWAAIVGGVAGLCWLTRYEAIALLPAVLVYWYVTGERETRWRQIMWTVIAFLALALPWFARCSVAAGRPFLSVHSYELVMMTDSYPGQTLYRMYRDVPRVPGVVALAHPRDMLRKMNRGLSGLYGAVGRLGQTYVAPFFWVGLILCAIRKRNAAFQWCLLLTIALQALMLSMFMPLERLLLPFTPMIILLAVFWFRELVTDYLRRRSPRTVQRRQFMALVALSLVAAYPTASYLFATPAATESLAPEVMEELSRHSHVALATDVAWVYAWYADRPALYIPQTLGDLRALRERNLDPDAIYLSRMLMNYPAYEMVRGWQRMLLEGGNLRLDERAEQDDYELIEDWRRAGRLWVKATAR